MSTPRKPGEYITGIIYEKIVGEQVGRLEELKDPSVIYVTDLVTCTHKFHLKKAYPWLSITFEPSTVLGNVAHWGLSSILRERGFEVEVEVSQDVEVGGKSYKVKGRVDALDRSNKLVVEIKTARAAIGLPKDHHVKQLNIYLNMLGYEHGVLLYLTPDKLVEYFIEIKHTSLYEEIVNLLEDKYHPRYGWECRYCIFSKLCPYYIESKGAESSDKRM